MALFHETDHLSLDTDGTLSIATLTAYFDEDAGATDYERDWLPAGNLFRSTPDVPDEYADELDEILAEWQDAIDSARRHVLTVTPYHGKVA